MRRGYRKIWWIMPCTSKKIFRSESRKDIEAILKSKLATIIEDDAETLFDNSRCGTPVNQLRISPSSSSGTKGIKTKMIPKIKIGRYFLPHFSLKDSYVLFVTGFASKGSFPGLVRY